MKVRDRTGLCTATCSYCPLSNVPRGHGAVLCIVKGKRDNFATSCVRPRFLAEILERRKQERITALGRDGKMLGSSIQRFTSKVKSVCEALEIAALEFTSIPTDIGGRMGKIVLGDK